MTVCWVSDLPIYFEIVQEAFPFRRKIVSLNPCIHKILMVAYKDGKQNSASYVTMFGFPLSIRTDILKALKSQCKTNFKQ